MGLYVSERQVVTKLLKGECVFSRGYANSVNYKNSVSAVNDDGAYVFKQGVNGGCWITTLANARQRWSLITASLSRAHLHPGTKSKDGDRQAQFSPGLRKTIDENYRKSTDPPP